MKIGFVLECTPQGPDADIYPYVAKLICPSVEIAKPETLRNKQNVMSEGALVALTLLETGCDYVFIIWDRMPRWGGTGRCADHVAQLEAELTKQAVDRSRVFLHCIDEMLESWIVADARGINQFFIDMNSTRRVKEFADCKSKASQSDPKNKIISHARNNRVRYDEFINPIDVVKRMPDFGRVAQRNVSFRHFKESVEQICP